MIEIVERPLEGLCSLNSDRRREIALDLAVAAPMLGRQEGSGHRGRFEAALRQFCVSVQPIHL